MNQLRFFTSGESHGKALMGIIEGIPGGLELSSADIVTDLKRRQQGYGRGGRMKIESDHAEILSGVRHGRTLGSPISLMIENRDWKNWTDIMSVEKSASGPVDEVTRARPGHADLSGVIKYNHKDIRNILERSSARETAMRVALGAIARKFLSAFNVNVGSFVVQIGSRKMRLKTEKATTKRLLELSVKAESSSVRCPDEKATEKMVEMIDEAGKRGDSLGGIFQVYATGLPVGLGSHVQWDRKLDGRLAQAVMSIQAIKGVEIGSGFEMGGKFGSAAMDEIFYGGKKGFYRKTNNAGGIEGGMTNGMPLTLRAVMKPIPTQKRPLRSVDIVSKEATEAAYERSDTCAVPAAAVIGEAMTALVLADAFLEKFGGDSMDEIRRNHNAYQKYTKKF